MQSRAMYPSHSWSVGDNTSPEPPPSSFADLLASMASVPSGHDSYPSDCFPYIPGEFYVSFLTPIAGGANSADTRSTSTESDLRPYAPLDTMFYNSIPPGVHQHRLPSSVNSDTRIGPGINSNPNSNVRNYPYNASDFDTSQYQFNPSDSAPHTPSTSEGTGYSTTSPGSGSLMSHQLVPNTCRSKDPDLQQLADAIINRRLSLGHEALPDLYVAQFFSIEIVSGIMQPSTNRRKRREKPRPKKMLAYHCLWCQHWVGYSKEKARQHFLVDLNMKGITCVEPECAWKTARPSDFTRHMKLVHKKDQPRKKSGGAMRPGKPFTELQKAYRNGERAFPVNAGQNPSHVSATTNGLTFAAHIQPTTSQLGWIGAFPQFSNPTESEQVCLMLHTQYNRPRWRWHIWGTTVSAVPGIAGAVVYSVCVKKFAEPSNSIPPASDAKSKQIESFLWSTVISSVLSATIMTIPTQSTSPICFV